MKYHSIMMSAAISSLVILALGCNDSSFKSNPGKARYNPKTENAAKTTPAADLGQGSNTQPTSDPGSGGQSTPNNQNGGISDGSGQNLTPCPPQNENILIIDMKSGWWAGDGGNFYQTMTKELAMPCSGAVAVEYHHVIKDSGGLISILGGLGGGDFTFIDNDWSGFTQIWLLSGALNDDLDIAPTDPTFVKIKDKIVASTATVFIGAGFGSILHANPLAEGLGFGALFGTDNAQGPLLSPQSGVTVTSRLTRGTHFADHPLFSRGINSIADNLNMLSTLGMGLVKGDYLNDNPSVEIAGKNTEGRNSIGVSKTGRRVVFDAGLQRFYSFWGGGSKDPETLIYIQNIIVYLSL